MPSAFYNMNDETASGLFYKMPVFRSDFRVIDDNMLHRFETFANHHLFR